MNNIKKAREAAGMTQQFVALSLGVKGPSVSNWESGKTKPNTENLAALSKLLDVSVDYLLGREEAKPSALAAGASVGTGQPVDALDQQLADEWADATDEMKRSTIAYIKFQKLGLKE